VTLCGILLAAGAGSRFGGGKLLHPLDDGTPLGLASLHNLLAAGLHVTAVVRAGDAQLARYLAEGGASVVECPEAHRGMAHSLVCAINATPGCRGWLIALGDMPRVSPQTIRAVATALTSEQDIVAPVYRGQRGNPIAIGAAYREELLKLSGDAGARLLLQRHVDHVIRLEVDDPGVLADVDTPPDLARLNVP
jgi:molybdenum cofactor cytidylyltransferase